MWGVEEGGGVEKARLGRRGAVCREAGDRVLVLLAGLPVTLTELCLLSGLGAWCVEGPGRPQLPQVAGWAGGPSILSFIYSADIFELPL